MAKKFRELMDRMSSDRKKVLEIGTVICHELTFNRQLTLKELVGHILGLGIGLRPVRQDLVLIALALERLKDENLVEIGFQVNNMELDVEPVIRLPQ